MLNKKMLTKSFRILLGFSIVFAVIISVTTNSSGQKNSLPDGLTKKSSLAETLEWLNKNSFAQARIGLNSIVPAYGEDHISSYLDAYSEWTVFSQGFKVKKIEECKLTLRNEDVKLISYYTANPDPKYGSFADLINSDSKDSINAGEIVIPLNRLKPNKATFQHTKNADKANLLGIWQTSYKKRADFIFFPSNKNLNKLAENLMRLEIFDSDENSKNSFLDGEILTFTFDDKETSEKFDLAFRQAINLCKK